MIASLTFMGLLLCVGGLYHWCPVGYEVLQGCLAPPVFVLTELRILSRTHQVEIQDA